MIDKKDPIVNIKLATLAREVGFDWPCKTYYNPDKINKDGSVRKGNSQKGNIRNTGKVISAPTLYTLQAWFREVHNIHINLMWSVEMDYSCWVVTKGKVSNVGYGPYDYILGYGLVEACSYLPKK